RAEARQAQGDRPSERFVGAHVRSHEAPRFATGRGRYVDDMRVAGMLHGGVLRSTFPHARIVSVNAEAARKLPGVVTVLTPDDFKTMTHPFAPGRYAAGLRAAIMEYPTAVDKVRYIGEPVAAVA